MNKTLDRLSDRFLTRENAWGAFGLLAAVAGVAISRQLIKAGWRATTGENPPENPASDDTTWMEALVWALATGAIIGVVRAASLQGAKSALRRWS